MVHPVDDERNGSSEVLSGYEAVRRVADEISALGRRIGSGVVGSAWAVPSLAAAPTAGWAVVVRDPDDQLAAAAVLLDVAQDDRLVTTLAGSEAGVRGFLLSDSRSAGTLLCSAVADEVERRGLEVDFGPIAASEPLIQELFRCLPACRLDPADPIPYLRRGAHGNVESYLGNGTRRTLRKARNRMAADGLTCQIDFLRDGDEVESLLPEMTELYRDRDHEGSRTSSLDTAVGREIWRRRILGLLGAGRAEVATLRLDGDLAAYALGTWDAGWYGIPEGRFRTSYARYAPGRVLEAAVVQRMLDDPEMVGVDWLSAVAPETLIAANGAQPTYRLTSRVPEDGALLPPSFPRPRTEPALRGLPAPSTS